MIKVAVVLYAILLYPDGIREQQVISWNLPFATFPQCQMFFNQNATNLKDGVVVHGDSQYEEGMTLTEMGCTKVILTGNGDIPRDDPKNRVVHYQRGQST